MQYWSSSVRIPAISVTDLPSQKSWSSALTRMLSSHCLPFCLVHVETVPSVKPQMIVVTSAPDPVSLCTQDMTRFAVYVETVVFAFADPRLLVRRVWWTVQTVSFF